VDVIRLTGRRFPKAVTDRRAHQNAGVPAARIVVASEKPAVRSLNHDSEMRSQAGSISGRRLAARCRGNLNRNLDRLSGNEASRRHCGCFLRQSKNCRNRASFLLPEAGKLLGLALKTSGGEALYPGGGAIGPASPAVTSATRVIPARTKRFISSFFRRAIGCG
jgi:hypothetical protein